MSKITQINTILADAAGLTEQRRAAMSESSWCALSDRLYCDDPPESDLRACLAFMRAMSVRRVVDSYESHRTLVVDLGVAQTTRNELETELRWLRSELVKRGGVSTTDSESLVPVADATATLRLANEIWEESYE